MTEYLAQSPPLSPAGSEPDSPRCSLSSCNELSRYSRQISDPESSSSETESDQSDVFTENEVTTYTYTRMFLPFLLLTKSGEIFQHFSFCSLLFICEGEFVLLRCPFSGFKLSVNKNYGSICWVELGSNSQFFVLFFVQHFKLACRMRISANHLLIVWNIRHQVYLPRLNCLVMFV